MLVKPPTLHARLHEIAIETSDVAGLSTFYRRIFGYSFSSDPEGMIGIARDRRLRLVEGQPKKLSRACFAVGDGEVLRDLAERLEQTFIPHAYRAWPGMLGEAIELSDPDGNRFLFGLAAEADRDGEGVTGTRPARLQHIVFASRDADRLLNFYRDVLGFDLSDRVIDDQGGLRTAFLRCSEEHHSLAVFYANEDRLDHHCFEAGDWLLIRDWADHFAAEHVPLKWGPGRHGPGNNLFVFIHDPEGNWLELSAELEVVAKDRPTGVWPHEERTLDSWGMGLLRS